MHLLTRHGLCAAWAVLVLASGTVAPTHGATNYPQKLGDLDGDGLPSVLDMVAVL